LADIFMSYASEDRDRVFTFVRALSDHGWSVWWDRHMIAGESFEAAIDHEIQHAACVMVFWSDAALGSRWVRNEALEGLERDVLVPVMLNPVRVPVAFRHCQVVTAQEPLDVGGTAFSQLCDAVRKFVTPREGSIVPAPAPPQDARATIAVMPLRCGAPDDQDRFLLEGLLDGVCARLARVPGFFVISSSSTIGYLGQSVDGVEVGRSLGVRYVVGGTYRRHGGTVRITAQLAEAASGTILWSESIQVSADAIEAAEEELVDSVIARLEPELARAELKRLSPRRTSDLDAWSLFRTANARLQLNGWHADVIREATSLLDAATERDPGFALAHAAKSVMLGVGHRMALWTEGAEQAEAESAAERALALDDSDSRVLGFVGCALADFGATDRAMVLLDKALEMDPSNPQALFARSLAWADRGDLARAIADGERAMQVSPRDSRLAGWLMSHVNILLRAGRTEEALEYAEFACRRDPRLYLCWIMMAVCHVLLGDPSRARDSLAEAHRIYPSLDRERLFRLIGRRTMGVLDGADVWPEAWRPRGPD